MSTKRRESDEYDYAVVIGQTLGSTHDPSGGKGENMVEYSEGDATETNTSSTGNARLSSISSTQKGHYENTHTCKRNNDDHGNQSCEHDPDDNDLYQNSSTIKIVANDDLYQNVPNVSCGKSNRSTVIPSDNGENGNQVGTGSDTVISDESAQESSASLKGSGAEASVIQNTTNRQIQASGCLLNIHAHSVIVNMPN